MQPLPCRGRRAAVVLAALIAIAGASIDARAQQRSPEGPDALTLDFRAIGGDGRLITDLAAADLSVRIDGRPRAIRGLQLVTVATAEPAAGTSPLPPPFATSRAAGGRSLILALDEDSLLPGREARLREAVDVLLAGLARRDMVSVVTMPYGGVKVPFTDDHTRISRALLTLSGKGSRSETESEMACRSRRVLESLTGLLGTIDGGDGPVTVVFFSSAMAGLGRDAAAAKAPGMCELTKEPFEAVGVAAARARANFYVVQPDDSSVVTQTDANPLAGLENLAGVTGGERIHLATTPAALQRVLDETASYYLASLEPQASDRPGSRHTVDLRVTRDRVTIRARPAMHIDPRETPARRARASAREMLRVADGAGALPLRAAGYVSRNTADTVKIVFVAEPIDPATRFTTAAAGLISNEGRLIAQWSADDPSAVPLMGGMPVKPGQYRLRIAATDGAGRGGTADAEIDAALTPAGPLNLSSLVLGLSRGGQFLPRLQFGPEPVALGTLEIYGGAAGLRVSAMLEVSATPDGPALLTVPLAIEAGGADRFVATGALPIGTLPPGDFVVRAIVGVEGQPPGRVTRTLRKAAAGPR